MEQPDISSLDDEIAEPLLDNTDESALEDGEAEATATWLAVNVAENFEDAVLDKLADELLKQIDIDDQSRSGWKTKTEDYLKLASQVVEAKNFPWTKAANIKYPLLTMAATQFQSRAYKSLLSHSTVVRTKVTGKDTHGLKAERANNISRHMSYQLLEEMEDWEEELDTLLMVLPIVGNVFRKTYFDGDRAMSELVLPQDLIVNYYAKSVETAQRKTHVITSKTKNDLVSYMRSGYFKTVDVSLDPSLPEPGIAANVASDGQGMEAPAEDTDAPYVIYECHCWLDMDGDGYKEPYKVHLLKESRKIVRISARYTEGDIVTNQDGEIIKIKPMEEFTNFKFIPDPNSGVMALGFGHILGPLNEAANTLINQLVDAGTLSILPSGFMARGVRMRAGEHPLQPGEFRYVSSTGDDLRKNIVPLPIKEPSGVLMNLLTFLAETGMSLSSVTDIMQGKNPGQNQPFSTTKEVLEQGMSVYSSIYKRIYRSLKKEFQKIYVLNRYYLPPQVYFSILDPKTGDTKQGSVDLTDYQMDEIDVLPAADPNQISEALDLAKSEQLMMLSEMGIVNRKEAGKRMLVAQRHEDIQSLLDIPEPEMDFDQKLKAEQMKLDAARADRELDQTEFKLNYQAARDEAAAIKLHTESMVMQLTAEVAKATAAFNQGLALAQREQEAMQKEMDDMRADREADKNREHEKEMNKQKESQTKVDK